MDKKLFIVIELDQNGTISDFNVEHSFNDADLGQKTDLVKRSKCPSCSCELEISMLFPVEQGDIYEINEEEVYDDEHFKETGQEAAESGGGENEENIASGNLTVKSPVRTSRKSTKLKGSRVRSVKKEVKEKPMEVEKCSYVCKKRAVIKADDKVCSQCCKTFRLPGTLRIHIQRCHRPKSYCCHLCGSAFVRNKELQDHLLRHENPKVSRCFNFKIPWQSTMIFFSIL